MPIRNYLFIVRSQKLKKDALNKLNSDVQKYSRELTEKTDKLKDTEDKLLSLSNQQAAKLAMLSKTRTTLRSKSSERDKYEQENQSLKDQLAEANKKITKLHAETERKGKMKVDLEVKMTANKDGVEFKSDLRDNVRNSEASDHYYLNFLQIVFRFSRL